MPAPSLSELQAWFLTAIMTPGGTEPGLALARRRHGLDECDVLRPAGAGHATRLHVHADGYVLRLLEGLRAEFPVLCRALGAALFDFFARAYVWRHPPRSTTLYDLGAGFADFLAHSRPAGMAHDAALDFPVQLARLERALAEAGRAPGLERGAAAPDVRPLLAGADVALVLAPCTRLLAAAFPLPAYWRQAMAAPAGADAPPMPQPAPTLIAVGRSHYRVAMHVLEPWQFHFLQAAATAAGGAGAHACALHAAQACALPAGRVLADALLWLPAAASASLLAPRRP